MRIRVSVAEVESFDGVGRGLIGLIRLWKFVGKSESAGAKPAPVAPGTGTTAVWLGDFASHPNPRFDAFAKDY